MRDKRRERLRCLTTGLAALLLGGVAFGQSVRTLDLPKNLEQALIVVVASWKEPVLLDEGTEREGRYRDFLVPLAIHEWLKGGSADYPTGIAIVRRTRPEVTASEMWSAQKRFAQKRLFLFSETSMVDGSNAQIGETAGPVPWSVPLQEPDVPDLPGLVGGTLTDRVAVILGRSCCGKDAFIAGECATGVGQCRSALAVPLLRMALERHRDDTARYDIAEALLLCGAEDVLELAAEYASHTDEPPRWYVGSGRSFLVGTVSRRVDAGNWRLLLPLATHPDEHTRRAFYYRLRELALADSIPILAAGLDDSDELVQYRAGTALVKVLKEKGKLYPAVSLFKGNREYYIEAWKRLAKEHAPSEDAGNVGDPGSKNRLSPVAPPSEGNVRGKPDPTNVAAEQPLKGPAGKPTPSDAPLSTAPPREAQAPSPSAGPAWTYLVVGSGVGLAVAAAGAWLLLRKRSGGASAAPGGDDPGSRGRRDGQA